MDKKFWPLLRLCTGIGLLVMLLAAVLRFSEGDAPPSSGMHFVLMVPEQYGTLEPVRETVASLESAYHLRLELHTFPSAAEQKRLLRLLPETEVDGVLLWPISVNEADYAGEAQALSEAGIPFVVVDRDMQQSLRDSFIGSGYKSDLLVLSQSLRALDGGAFIVGSRFSGSGGQVVELLFFERDGDPVSFPAPRDAKLQQLAKDPPDGYRAVDCRQVEAANALQMKQLLVELFSGPQAPELFFSLEQTLSSAAASAKRDLPEDCGVHLLCYGEQSENQSYLDLESGVVDGLVTTLPEVSVSIGVRYLRDICRGFWVPDSMDSGTTLLTRKELEAGGF